MIFSKTNRYLLFTLPALIFSVLAYHFFCKSLNLRSENERLENELVLAPSKERSEFRELMRNAFGNRTRGLILISFHIFETNGSFTEAFIEIFDISNSERKELEEISEYALDEYFRLSKSNTTIRLSEDGSIRLEVKPFKGAHQLYNKLLIAFERVLGEQRHSDLIALAEPQLRERYLRFGGKKLEVVVSTKPDLKKLSNGTELRRLLYHVNAYIESESGKSLTWGAIHSYERFELEFEIVKRLIEDAGISLPTQLTQLDEQKSN